MKYALPRPYLSIFVVIMAFVSSPLLAVSPTIQSDTPFLVTLMQDLDTATAKKGDQVLTVIDSCGRVQTDTCPFKGDYMYGTVFEAKNSGKVNSSSALVFHFTEIEHANQRISIHGSLNQVTNSKGAPDVDEEGRAIKKKNNVGKVVATTVAGAALGALLGGAKGAAIGAAAGAGAGMTMVEVSDSGSSFKLAKDSKLLLSVSPDTRPEGSALPSPDNTRTRSTDESPSIPSKYTDAQAFHVLHDHGNDTNPATWKFCRGVLYVFADHVRYEVEQSNDSRNDQFDLPYHDVLEVRKNFWPIASREAFHIKLKSGSTMNFVPDGTDVGTVLGAFPAPPRR